ncbi:hypothetical protein K466DRAFT_304198 [Polyporus arcularius HHB13444]|uniref:Uncharacterized protein n=1 Tax=Polyporus arcularius HHB13444 TaxID=1314778 RepID=A0A5C3P202_9APHY|nr:hypothetical protein K466DRAFT_304198 [Polyporus arcularius HHB13444]
MEAFGRGSLSDIPRGEQWDCQGVCHGKCGRLAVPSAGCVEDPRAYDYAQPQRMQWCHSRRETCYGSGGQRQRNPAALRARQADVPEGGERIQQPSAAGALEPQITACFDVAERGIRTYAGRGGRPELSRSAWTSVYDDAFRRSDAMGEWFAAGEEKSRR